MERSHYTSKFGGYPRQNEDRYDKGVNERTSERFDRDDSIKRRRIYERLAERDGRVSRKDDNLRRHGDRNDSWYRQDQKRYEHRWDDNVSRRDDGLGDRNDSWYRQERYEHKNRREDGHTRNEERTRDMETRIGERLRDMETRIEQRLRKRNINSNYRGHGETSNNVLPNHRGTEYRNRDEIHSGEAPQRNHRHVREDISNKIRELRDLGVSVSMSAQGPSQNDIQYSNIHDFQAKVLQSMKPESLKQHPLFLDLTKPWSERQNIHAIPSAQHSQVIPPGQYSQTITSAQQSQAISPSQYNQTIYPPQNNQTISPPQSSKTISPPQNSLAKPSSPVTPVLSLNLEKPSSLFESAQHPAQNLSTYSFEQPNYAVESSIQSDSYTKTIAQMSDFSYIYGQQNDAAEGNALKQQVHYVSRMKCPGCSSKGKKFPFLQDFSNHWGFKHRRYQIRYPCPVTDCTAKPTTRSGLANHIRQKHKMSPILWLSVQTMQPRKTLTKHFVDPGCYVFGDCEEEEHVSLGESPSSIEGSHVEEDKGRFVIEFKEGMTCPICKKNTIYDKGYVFKNHWSIVHTKSHEQFNCPQKDCKNGYGNITSLKNHYQDCHNEKKELVPETIEILEKITPLEVIHRNFIDPEPYTFDIQNDKFRKYSHIKKHSGKIVFI